MAVLNDEEIIRLIDQKQLLENWEMFNLQAASYDLRTGKIEDVYGDTILKPGEFRLISTKEKVNMPNNIAGFLKTKSTLARIGIVAGDVGGWIDPGFRGNLTISVFNLGRRDFDLSEVKSLSQIIFVDVSDDVEGAYDGHYQDSTDIEESVIVRTNTKNTSKETDK